MGKREQLENDRLLIEIDEMGAELSRIYDKEKKREVLWGGDPGIWNRKSPILFPFVGNCYQKEYCFRGTTYPMGQHGFARDRAFVKDGTENGVLWFSQEDDEETRKVYPFHYRLEVGHGLAGNQLEVFWKVTNTGDEEMLFMIGGHPAFRIPEGRSLYDFTLKFQAETGLADVLAYKFPDSSGYVPSSNRSILQLKQGTVPVTPGFFDDQVLTYIFPGAQVEEVSLLLPGDEPYVTVKCPDFPYLAIWTKEKTHPFVCLEPWFGRASDHGFTGELKERAGILALQPKTVFAASYIIEIH